MKPARVNGQPLAPAVALLHTTCQLGGRQGKEDLAVGRQQLLDLFVADGSLARARRPHAGQCLCLRAGPGCGFLRCRLIRTAAVQRPGHGCVQQTFELSLLVVVDDGRTARRRRGGRAGLFQWQRCAAGQVVLDQALVRRDHALHSLGRGAAVALNLQIFVDSPLVPELAVEQSHGQVAVPLRNLSKLGLVDKIAQPPERLEEHEALAVVAVAKP